jgi:hypothetical protein
MSTNEQPVYRYGDFPELFWDLQREEIVDGTNPAIVARLLEHARPEIIWKLVPDDVLLRDFEKLDLPEHTRRFWSIVVGTMREERGIAAPEVAETDRGITYRTRPRYGDLPSTRHQPVEEGGTYRYGDLPELFWDLPPETPVDGSDPSVLARLLENAPPKLVWQLVDVNVLLREFDGLDIPRHTRGFWSIVVDGIRKDNESQTGSQTAA